MLKKFLRMKILEKTLFALVFLIVVGQLSGGRAIALTSLEIRDQYYKSYNYENLQDYQNAIKSLIPIFEKYSKSYTINLRLGWLYYLKKNYANSIHHYQNAIKAAPYSIEAKLGYSLPLMIQEKYARLEALLYQILSADQNNYYANLKLAMACRFQKKYDLAEKITKGMLTLYPVDVSFLTELALLKQARGEKAEAAELFWNILILDPENIVAKTYLGK